MHIIVSHELKFRGSAQFSDYDSVRNLGIKSEGVRWNTVGGIRMRP